MFAGHENPKSHCGSMKVLGGSQALKHSSRCESEVQVATCGGKARALRLIHSASSRGDHSSSCPPYQHSVNTAPALDANWALLGRDSADTQSQFSWEKSCRARAASWAGGRRTGGNASLRRQRLGNVDG